MSIIIMILSFVAIYYLFSIPRIRRNRDETKRILEIQKSYENIEDDDEDIDDVDDSSMMNCRVCAEEIKKEAIKCTHCGEYTQNYDDTKSKINLKGSENITKKYIWYIVVFVIAAGYWMSKGTPNPALFFAGDSAKQECLRLANENKDSMFFFNNETIRANDTWLKDGKRVVQLLQDDDGDGMKQIMCIYGNGMVEIPSMLNQGKWR